MENRSTHRWCRPFQGRRVFRKEAGSDPARSSALSVHPSKERPLKAIPQAGWLLARLDARLRETTRVGSAAPCELRTTPARQSTLTNFLRGPCSRQFSEHRSRHKNLFE